MNGNSKSATCNATVTVAIVVKVSPTSVNVQTGKQQQFTATVKGANDTSVTWSVPGGSTNGTIDQNGLYTAPAIAPSGLRPNPGSNTVSVVATSVEDPMDFASASVQITWHIGGGSFTKVQFGNGFSADDKAYITEHFNQVYPMAVDVLDLPPDTSPITFQSCSWGFGTYTGTWDTHTMCVGSMPSVAPDLASWNGVFDHELCHGMMISQYTGVGNNWTSEAFADVGSRVLARMSGNPNLVNEIDYDVLRLGGKEYVGGIDGKSWRGIPDPAYVNEESGADILEFLLTTQSVCQAGDWTHCTALKDLKAGMYDIANQKQDRLTQDDFLAAIGEKFSQPIEGVLPAEWVAAQPVAYTYGKPGVYLYAHLGPAATADYGTPAINQWLEIGCLQRLTTEVQPGIPKEIPCTTGTVTVTVSNSSGKVATITHDMSSPSHELAFDVTGYRLGAYRVQASGTANGAAVSSNSYFGIFDPTKAPPGHTMGAMENVLFLIGVNPDGTPSSKAFPAPTDGAAGHFLENGNGVAIWHVDSTSLPSPEYTISGQRVPVPLPFSGVWVKTIY